MRRSRQRSITPPGGECPRVGGSPGSGARASRPAVRASALKADTRGAGHEFRLIGRAKLPFAGEEAADLGLGGIEGQGAAEGGPRGGPLAAGEHGQAQGGGRARGGGREAGPSAGSGTG